MRRLAFTLVEMLTVIAISAIMLTIIVLPVFQSFNLTRAAEGFADAQDQARRLTERISYEVGNAVSVRNESGLITPDLTDLGIAATSLPAHSLVVQVPGKNGQTVSVVMPWTKLDIVEPAQGQVDPTLAVGQYRDPISGKIDPTLVAPKGQVHVPVTPGYTEVRYFIGLRDPFSLYNDPYSGILMKRSGSQDNLYVLYRAEFQPNITTSTGSQGNPALFKLDGNNQSILDDPTFFVADRDSSGNVLQNNHNVLLYHWLGKMAPWETGTALMDTPLYFAHTVLQTEVSRYDMILPQYNVYTHVLNYSGNLPRLTPLVQFRPTVISNDPASGQEALRPGQESDNAAAVAPDVYKTQYGLWSSAIVREYPAGFLSSASAQIQTTYPLTRTQYLVGYTPLTGTLGFAIFYHDPATSTSEFQNSSGQELFDSYTYDNNLSNGIAFPFTAAALSANSNTTYGGWLNNPTALNLFTPFHLLTGTGKILASFDITEVGNINATTPVSPNLPSLQLDTVNPPQSPLLDKPTSAVYSGTGYDINHCFDYIWNNTAYNLQSTGDSNFGDQRFLDLRITPNQDGTMGPLYPGAYTDPNTMKAGVNGFEVAKGDGSVINRCRIVPGSEVVYGPDQISGPNYGRMIRYIRVTRNPGPNQYRINYVDQQEPTEVVSGNSKVDANAYQQAFNLPSNLSDLTGFNPLVYSPTNLVSAVLEPRFKGGYIQFDSDPGTPMPNGYTSDNSSPYDSTNQNFVAVPIQVDYRFQFTGTLPSGSLPPGAGQSDVFAVDYDSRQLMQILLTIRNLPQTTVPNPQSVTLEATALIRNVTQ